MSSAFLLAKCAVCVAQDNSHGWWVLSGTVLLGASLVAGFFVWQDRRTRVAAAPPDDLAG